MKAPAAQSSWVSQRPVCLTEPALQGWPIKIGFEAKKRLAIQSRRDMVALDEWNKGGERGRSGGAA
jgi:hypothetical protein